MSLAKKIGGGGVGEGGCGGNSAVPERNQNVDSHAVLLESAGHHRKILFSSLAVRHLTQRMDTIHSYPKQYRVSASHEPRVWPRFARLNQAAKFLKV